MNLSCTLLLLLLLQPCIADHHYAVSGVPAIGNVDRSVCLESTSVKTDDEKNIFAGQCCTNEGVLFRPDCTAITQTWQQAFDVCATANLRLCTRAELLLSDGVDSMSSDCGMNANLKLTDLHVW